MRRSSQIWRFLVLCVTLIMVASAFVGMNNTDDAETWIPEQVEMKQESPPREAKDPEADGPMIESGSTILPGSAEEIQVEQQTRSPETIEYRINAGWFEITEKDGVHSIEMLDKSYGVIDSPGNPGLPEKILEFQVHEDIDWTTVELTVESLDYEVLQGRYYLAPVPPQWIGDTETGYEDWGVGKSITYGENIFVYRNDAIYPENALDGLHFTERKVMTESGPENAKFLRVAYRPFQFNPVSRELTLNGKVSFRITYHLLSSPPQFLTTGTYDYVIITTNDVVASSDRLDNFINLKELTHDVLVVTEDDFDGLTGQAPNERPDKIRKWLMDNQGPMGIDYVLLIGDPDPDDPKDPDDHVGDLPMKYCWPNFLSYKCYEDAAYNGCPTDYYYADLTGDWDLDGDEMYGECVDFTNDKSPDPSIGENTFSAEWTGEIMCDFAESYTFRTFSDDGVELIIDGTTRILDWGTTTWPESNTAVVAMTAGKHDITVRYHEHTDHGIIKLYWKTTNSDNVEEEIIPDTHLYDLLGVDGGLNATYYNNEDFTGATVERKDSTVDFFWGTGDRGVGGMDVGADVFVGRIPVYDDDYDQLDYILEKIIKYETDAGSISWRESALLTMAPLAANTPAYHYGEEVKDNILPPGWSYYRIYDDDYSASGGPTPEDWPTSAAKVKAEWMNGYGLVTWWTHGSSGGASHIFDNTMCGDLDDTKPSIVFQSTCMNGYPESTNNLAYALLKHGSVANFASTRVSSGSRGNWTYDSTSAANPNFGYKTIDHLITDGYPTGAALYDAKDNAGTMTMNHMNYNLYGDPDCYFLTTVPNVPPVADAGGPYSGDEGSPITFDGSLSYDPDSYPAPLEYRWDFDGDGEWDTGWSTSPTAIFTWSDDYSGTVILEVSDSVLTDTDSAPVEVDNVAPDVAPLPSFTGCEPLFFYFTTDATDPGSDDLTFTWVYDYGPTISNVFYNDGTGPDPSDSYIGGVFPFTATDSASHEYGDNGMYTLTLTVEDDDGGVTVRTTTITVLNVEPTIEDVEAYILVDFTLRAAGEKWHNVEMYIYADTTLIGFAEVVRYPGSPDDQSVTLWDVKCDVTKVITVRVEYTPLDDIVNGQIWGATPCWVNLSFEDGGYNLTHHNFNVRHPDTWIWEFGVNKYFVGHEITFEATASDPGSDDLTFTWFWDDSTPDTVTTYYNDGMAADPYPSPDGIYPVSQFDTHGHIFTAEGNYNVQLTVEDDDGGAAVVVLVVILM